MDGLIMYVSSSSVLFSSVLCTNIEELHVQHVDVGKGLRTRLYSHMCLVYMKVQ